MIPRVSELLRHKDLAIVHNNGCYGFGSASTHKEKGKKVVTIKQLEVNEKNKELFKKMYEQLQDYNKDKEKERSEIFMNELFGKLTKK
jgi:tRNA A37 threonylcarbamoyladenosine synthetase subunit TsaC/SUA5/YrdC